MYFVNGFNFKWATEKAQTKITNPTKYLRDITYAFHRSNSGELQFFEWLSVSVLSSLSLAPLDLFLFLSTSPLTRLLSFYVTHFTHSIQHRDFLNWQQLENGNERQIERDKLKANERKRGRDCEKSQKNKSNEKIVYFHGLCVVVVASSATVSVVIVVVVGSCAI